MRPSGDGNDYQLWARLLIGASVVTLIIDRFTPPDGGKVFALSIFFLLIALTLVPDDSQPPQT